MKKKILIAAALSVMAFSLFGCQKIELTDDEEELFVAYVVENVLKFDYDYMDKLLDVEVTTAAPEKPSQEETTGESPTGNGTSGNENSGKEASLTELFDEKDFSFEAAGYEVTKRYETEDGTVSMTAIDGKKLLVIKIRVKNNAGETRNLKLIGSDKKYTAVVNGNRKLNPQIWANDITLNVFEGDFAAGESRELVLAFQLDESITEETIRLSVVNGDKSGYVIIK